MSREQVCERVIQVIGSSVQIPLEKIRPESRLVEDLDIDSLFVVQLVMELEDTFKVRIEDEDIKTFKTVQDVVDYVFKKQSVE